MTTETLCHCGEKVHTFIVQIPACRKCYEAYDREGRQYLADRPVFRKFIQGSRLAGHRNAVGYTFPGVDFSGRP